VCPEDARVLCAAPAPAHARADKEDATEQTGRQEPLPIPEDPQERLKHYRLDRFVKTLPALPRSKGDIYFDPKREDVKQYYVRVPVESLADLKLWTGVPNDHIDHLRHWQHLRSVPSPSIAKGRDDEMLRELGDAALADAEYNILHGFVDDVLIEDPHWGAIVRGLLERMQFINILTIDHLVVQDGQRVTISNTPTAYINRVTVYGSGSIVFASRCKLISDMIEHL
jgi:hypothetical protein